jgi:hypothetical protein
MFNNYFNKPTKPGSTWTRKQIIEDKLHRLTPKSLLIRSSLTILARLAAQEKDIYTSFAGGDSIYKNPLKDQDCGYEADIDPVVCKLPATIYYAGQRFCDNHFFLYRALEDGDLVRHSMFTEPGSIGEVYAYYGFDADPRHWFHIPESVRARLVENMKQGKARAIDFEKRVELIELSRKAV